MFGGVGSDILSARSGDLMVGGTTSVDNNNVALLAILAEWKSATPIATRRTNILAMGAVGGIGGLNINDSAIDLLYGSADADDWFVGTTTQDRINNKSGNDKLNDA